MEEHSEIQNTHSDPDSRPARQKSIRFLPAIACLIFVVLGVAIFALSENYARKTSVGFPAFHESPFTLRDQNGVQRTNADFAGQPIALFFGFTYCPDVCPTTLLSLAGAIDDLSALGLEASNIQIVFVSVDFERDTPQQLKDYLSLFDVPVIGLTGDAEAVKAAIGSFGAYAQKITDADGGYVYDHSAAVYLYRDDGTFKGTIVHNEPYEFIAEKLKSLL